MSMRDETSQRKIEENTRQILEKIEELNRKQGLVKKKKPTYFHFPFSYSRSKENSTSNHQPQQRSEQEFSLPKSPFENPITQYLINQKDLPTGLKTSSSPDSTGGITVVETNPNAQITEEDEIPGQYVKRKVTHQQVMVVPSVQTYMNNRNNPAFQQYHQHMLNQQNLAMQNIPGYGLPNTAPPMFNPFSNNPDANRKNPIKPSDQMENLESQTLNNIKNIIYSSQTNPNYVNPYFSNLQPSPFPYYPTTSYKADNKAENSQAPALIYGPYVVPNLEAAQMTRQIQIQSPLYDYFPIMIKDPIMHFYTALTTMVEYGPQAGATSATCKGKDDSKQKSNSDSEQKFNTDSEQNTNKASENTTENNAQLPSASNSFTSNQGDSFKYDPENAENLNVLLKNLTDDEHITLEFENPNFQNEDENSGRGFNIRFPKNDLRDKETRVERLSSSVPNSKSPHYTIKENKVDLGQQMVRVGTKTNKKETSTTSRTVYIGNKAHLIDSPPNREQIPYEDEIEDDKGLGFGSRPEDIQVSHDGNKKLFSKDNTGSGIFIHKLKVRKGGVAIAGPGGIATAGDGGTAIVGPNGYAYTQPDSLAIAGTGTKVIAVEPTINLSDLLKGNRSRLEGPNSQRIGKLVAVGPVIYYNKG
ncbi:protein PF14_0175-like isoform X2 [Coccinella septempunctata]|nr:protein PF14_0175-like isoform X2 [Coccinella septempunctata]